MRKPAGPVGPVGPDTPIGASGFAGATVLRRVGPRLGIRTVRDLLFHLPRRYDDLRELSTARGLAGVPEGEPASARLQVRAIRVEQTFRRRVQRTTAYLGDDSGDVEATWFGRRFIANRLREGAWIVISGKIRRRGFTTTFDNPEFQADDGSALLHAGRIVPVYRLTAGLTAATLRRAIRQALDEVGSKYPEYLPVEAWAAPEAETEAAGAAGVAGSDRAGDGASTAPGGTVTPMPIAAALENAHYPETFPARDAALRRLGYDELLALQVGMVARDRGRRSAVGEPVDVPAARIRKAVEVVETALTEQVQARTGASDNKFSFLRDGTGHFRAQGFGPRLRLVASHFFQRTCKNNSLTCNWGAGRNRSGNVCYTHFLGEMFKNSTIVGFVKEVLNCLGNNFSYSINAIEVRFCMIALHRLDKGIQVPEISCMQFRCCLADMADA